MEDLNHRVLRLERSREIVRQGHAGSAMVDKGPYDADELIAGWAVDSSFDIGTEVFNGREEIHRFFADLAATYTIHFSTNAIVDLDSTLESADVRTYGLEAPVISGQALVGAFVHRATSRWAGQRWESCDREQTMYFLSPVTRGWDDAHRITEQRRSKGA